MNKIQKEKITELRASIDKWIAQMLDGYKEKEGLSLLHNNVVASCIKDLQQDINKLYGSFNHLLKILTETL